MPDTQKANPAGSASSEDTLFGLFPCAQPRRLAQVSISLLLTLLCERCQGFSGATCGWRPESILNVGAESGAARKGTLMAGMTGTIKAVPLRMGGGPLIT
jgi:hypothetical protein